MSGAPYRVLSFDGITVFRVTGSDEFELRAVRPAEPRLFGLRLWLAARVPGLRWLSPVRVEMARVRLTPSELANLVSAALAQGAIQLVTLRAAPAMPPPPARGAKTKVWS